jgi:dolichyl-phosphate beta-glucosyltransferase
VSTTVVKPLGVSVIIPAYNEEARLPFTLERIYRYLSARSLSFEIIVVDDGSVDRTAEIAETFLRARSSGHVLRNDANQGKGFSVKRGVLGARGEYILFSDADLSTPIEELYKVLKPILAGNCDIAIASRANGQSEIRVSQPWHRRMTGQVFNILVRLLAVRSIKDTQCGFKCFTRPAAMSIFSRQQLNGFGFDVEILYIAQKSGYVTREIPVAWINSPGSRVHVLADSVRMFLDLWRIRFNGMRGLYAERPQEESLEEVSRIVPRP